MGSASQKRAKRAKWEKKHLDKVNHPAKNAPSPAKTSEDFEESELCNSFSDNCSTSEEEEEQ
ncbi:hypothetical protein DAPPUDRAFT_265920 [Daphnia pulex]|uniref:Uncharacterized protein n=1 Tax=Daphnia pulex TaxID=6669 RepID=E9HU76_DAPPU|nr:hypothetical protein DAPPUDRAFT_265920 [Daphnia pulex]|eukprot:EFX64694.1 hypothetical protein DAPPUDRAFT_265920 [Daphnia pulex]